MKTLKYALLITTLSILPLTAATLTYNVAVNTSSVNGKSGTIDLEFNPGANSLPADLAITDFISDGVIGNSPALTGDVSGTLSPGPLDFDNATGFNDYFNNFTYGTSLSFLLTLSGQAVNSPNPADDGSTFALSILNSAGTASLMTVSDPAGFAGTLTLNGNGSVSVVDFTSGKFHATNTAVPEPSSWVLLLGGLLLFARKRVWATAACCIFAVAPSRADTWTLWGASTPPPPAANQAMVYDSLHKQIVLTDASANGLTTWVWDGQNWDQKSPTANPPSRDSQAMVFDSVRGQVVLFGGTNGTTALNDTWVWDGASWTQKNPATSPPARVAAMMAFDPLHGQAVLFGGTALSGIPFGDTWLWDGTNWIEVDPDDNPSPRISGAITYDSSHSLVVLFGGIANTGYTNDTWVWDGSTWIQVPMPTSPSPRVGSAMVYDPAISKLVLFGGSGNIQNGTALNDTWEWDGKTWSQPQLTETLGPPQARFNHSMAYDVTHGYVVLFGGQSGTPSNLTIYGDTWTFGPQGGIVYTTAGNPQSAPIGNAFSFPLQATVLGPSPGRGIPGLDLQGISLNFVGPSQFVVLPQAPVTTDQLGHAIVTAPATSTAGSYTVTAVVAGGSGTFTLANVNTAPATGPCVVTTAADDNFPGSLRFQVAACGKGGVITFSPSLTMVNVGQNADIQITQDLTIDGGNGVVINAGQQSRVFFIEGGNVTLKNLTLEHGLALAGNGGDGYIGGGGAAGMGGAIFVNGGAVTLYVVSFLVNTAQGGNGGALSIRGLPAGSGGGMGGSALGFTFFGSNPGGGGDLGGAGGNQAGTGSQQNGGGGAGGGPAGNGGFGGGGGAEGSGGFGGGAGSTSATITPSNLPGVFGGNGWQNGTGVGGGGGGAGLGGAIFVNAGLVALMNCTFSTNSATGGNGGGSSQPPNSNGQGKGGALFINSGAAGVYFQNYPNHFLNDSASTANSETPCSIVGSGARDNSDICGVFNQANIGGITGNQQSAVVNTAFATPLSIAITENGVPVLGLPVTFASTGSGAALNPPSTTVFTNANGVASITAVANGTPGSYTVNAEVGGTGSIASFSLTNSQSGGPINVTSQVQVTSSGLVYSRVTQSWSTTITVTNIGASALASPLEAVFQNLPAGVTMISPSGSYQGYPYQTLTGPLARGASSSFPVQFSGSPSVQVKYSVGVYEGSLQ